jgi:predicted metal-dependent phosphoesterase TrpH
VPLHHLSNADLHCHSTASDGTLPPPALAERAAAAGVELWALTDHDELSGLAQAREAALDLGLAWLAGVEVSVSFAGETVHVLGLGIDPGNEALAAGLHRVRSGRVERAHAMAAGLARAGHPGAFEGAMAYVSNPNLISRTHFARWLVERGVCGHTHEVFQRFLTEGKPGFVPTVWAGLGETVRWIVGAGGTAVIAHPARYRFSPTAEYALFTEFMAHGGRAVEVVCGSHSAAEMARYAGEALEYGLLASRGSDFHDPDESRTAFGSLPPLAGQLSPVWMALSERIEQR